MNTFSIQFVAYICS